MRLKTETLIPSNAMVHKFIILVLAAFCFTITHQQNTGILAKIIKLQVEKCKFQVAT